ncbi:MAG: TetR/AcrR family transcriptional regulator [Myxococcales bacterium]|nr:TetR/AcrR family transcriptional regulator [Myxococcales bacterium]HIK84020.1 TetR/AcrR family transcriptional regulator [Myxococcales bacterium]
MSRRSSRKREKEHREKPVTGRRERMPREERRKQLMEVSRGVFSELGYEAASLEEIAERAGVSRPILYSHFGDKHGLFEAVVSEQIALVREVVAQSLMGPGEPRELVENSMRAFFTYVRDHPDGHAVLTRDAPVHISDSGLGVMLDGLAKDIALVIAAQIRAMGLDPSPAPIYANALVGIGAHIGRWWREHPDVSLDQVTTQTTDLIWSGFGGLTEAAK